MTDRASDHASLDREQAQKRAQAALRKPDLEWAHDLVHGPAHLVLAYEAELVRVERERDEAQRKFVRSLTTRREFVAMKLAEVERERDDWETTARAESDAVMRQHERVARLESQLAEARWALELISGGADDDLRLERAEMAGIAYAALAASAETPEAPDAA